MICHTSQEFSWGWRIPRAEETRCTTTCYCKPGLHDSGGEGMEICIEDKQAEEEEGSSDDSPS
jgi:hypothetical protein